MNLYLESCWASPASVLIFSGLVSLRIRAGIFEM